ncbi:MAG: response regulator [Anaerolineaceae bacterium]|nr:response regulator [Anaerolineaceae bacterium]
MKRVLIVDDANDFNRFLRSALQTLDIKLSVNTARSAEEALLQAAGDPVSLLVSDVRLPGITGFDLVNKLRAIHPDVRVIFITGLKSAEIRQQAEELKVDSFFTKPIELDSFLTAVQRCLSDAPTTEEERDQSQEAEPEADEEQSPEGLTALLSGLRQRVHARTALLLDLDGHVAALSGEIPDPAFEHTWVPRLLETARAQIDLCRMLGGSGFENVLALRGKAFDVALAPVGNYLLVLALTASLKDLHLALAYEETLAAQKSLQEILSRLGVEDHAPGLEMQPAISVQSTELETLKENDLSAFEALLEKTDDLMQTQDVDRFWETLTSSTQITTSNGDGISFDQARKMGLTPENNV